MIYCPDALDQYNAYADRLETALSQLPKCEICGEPIEQEMAVKLDGGYYCDNCLDAFRVCIGN